MTTGDRIRKARETAGLSRRQLAELSGVSESAISQYERKLRQPQASQLAKIAHFLNVSTDFLLGKTNNNIAQLRIEKGMSQQELADALGIAIDELVNIETGSKPVPTVRVMRDLGGVLGAGVQDVLSDAQMQELRSLMATFDNDKARRMIKLGLATNEYLRALHELGYTSKTYDIDSFPVDGITKLADMVVIICEGILAMSNQAESGPSSHVEKDESTI